MLTNLASSSVTEKIIFKPTSSGRKNMDKHSSLSPQWASVMKLFSTVIYHHSMVIRSFCVIKPYCFGKYCEMAVIYIAKKIITLAHCGNVKYGDYIKYHSNFNIKYHSNFSIKYYSNFNIKYHSNFNSKYHSNFNIKYPSNLP
jgi:hypothetical protein